tara:strand:- start:162 stop:278 length:117 start_codon:yes stop_codon:yes gene_type:complete
MFAIVNIVVITAIVSFVVFLPEIAPYGLKELFNKYFNK